MPQTPNQFSKEKNFRAALCMISHRAAVGVFLLIVNNNKI